MIELLLCGMMFADPPRPAEREVKIQKLVQEIADSGRVLTIEARKERMEDPKKQIAPGAPPLLSFRYFHGLDRHRFGKLDLMLDDAGH